MLNSTYFSELIQNFGFISNQKQIFNIVQTFLKNYDKILITSYITYENDNFDVYINSKCQINNNLLNQVIKIVKPFLVEYFNDNFSKKQGFININNLNIKYYEFELNDNKIQNDLDIELKGSIVIPVYLGNKISSIFVLISNNEFELNENEMLNISIFAYLVSYVLKFISSNQYLQTTILNFKNEKLNITNKLIKVSKTIEFINKLIEINDYKKLLISILNAYCTIFNIKQAAIFSINHQKQELVVEEHIGLSSDFIINSKQPLNSGLIGNVISKNIPYFRNNILNFSYEVAIIPYRGISGLPCGAIVLYDKFDNYVFDDDEFELMVTIANAFSLIFNMLKMRSLTENNIQTKAISHNVNDEKKLINFKEKADEIRLLLMPILNENKLPIQYSYEYLVCEEIGADFLDIFKTLNDQIIILIGDVNNRGLKALSNAISLKTKIRVLFNYYNSINKVVTELNNLLCVENEIDNFNSLFLMQIPSNSIRANFINAGFCPIVHYIKSEKNVIIHESKNLPLGIINNLNYNEGVLLLNEGDILIFFSNEIFNISEIFTKNIINFFSELLETCYNNDCNYIKNEIIKKLNLNNLTALHDDLLLLVVKVGQK